VRLAARVRSALVGLALGSGCIQGFAPEIDPNGTDVSDPVDAPFSVDPASGPVRGGTAVSISGVGLGVGTTVRFGEAEATVTVIDPTLVVADAPPSSVPGPVDLTVTPPGGAPVVLPGAYVYDSLVVDEGLRAAYIELTVLQAACPVCVGLPSLSVTADAVFHEPTTESWFDALPEIGTCQANFVPQVPAVEKLDLGPFVYLEAGTKSIALHEAVASTGGKKYSAADLDVGDIAMFTGWDLRIPDGGPWGQVFVQDAVQTGGGHDSVTPQELLLDDPNAFSVLLSRQGFTLSWSPGGTDSYRVLLDIYDPSGATSLGQVVCRGPDNGSLTVPAGMVSRFPKKSTVAVYMMREQRGTFPIEPAGAVGEVLSWIGFVGTALLW
jgi:hypothetical protein